MLAFIGSLAQSAAAQAAFAVSYSQLFSLITWTAVGLMGAAAAVAGQNLGAGNPDRAAAAEGTRGCASAAFQMSCWRLFQKLLAWVEVHAGHERHDGRGADGRQRNGLLRLEAVASLGGLIVCLSPGAVTDAGPPSRRPNAKASQARAAAEVKSTFRRECMS